MLDNKIINRIEWFSKQKINDFSPTISPAPKNTERREIESIYEAVQYFLRNEVNDLTIQKKYMGSYCTIYLKKELSETYFVSRNGYIINHIDTEAAIASVQDLHTKMLALYPDFDTILIASELLPWSILGSGLIEKEYLAYYDALHTHNQYLKESGLYEKIEKVKRSAEYLAFKEDAKRMTDKELKAKYKPHIIRQYKAVMEFPIHNLEMQSESFGIFKTQIDIFGKKEAIHFKPFTILKIVFQDGKEHLPNSNLTYAQVNEDEFLHLQFTAENQAENIAKIYAFFEKLTAENEEGIMIKPTKSFVKGLVPCFKVRNNHYLTMIYGVNFSNDFDYYLSRRNVKKKMEQSLQGWAINHQLLQIKYKDLNEENYLLKVLMLKRIQGEEIEKMLDPRL